MDLKKLSEKLLELKELYKSIIKGEDDFLDDIMEGKDKPPVETDMESHVTPKDTKAHVKQQKVVSKKPMARPVGMKIYKNGQWELDKGFYGPGSVHDKATQTNQKLKDALQPDKSDAEEVENPNPNPKLKEKALPKNPKVVWEDTDKADTEVVKYASNGQWSIEKSNYGPKGADLYDAKDNAKRKEKSSGEQIDSLGPNKRPKQYTSAKAGTAQAQAAAQAKSDAEKNKKQPVKIGTPEEVAAMNAKLGIKTKESPKE